MVKKIDPKIKKLIDYKKDSAFATFESINEASDKLDALKIVQEEGNKIAQEIASKEVPAPIVNVEAPIVNIPETVVNIPAPVVNVPAPIVNVEAPIVNVPEQKFDIPAPIVNIDTKKIEKGVTNMEESLKQFLAKFTPEEEKKIQKETPVNQKGN